MTSATATVSEDGSAVVELDGHPPHTLHGHDLPNARKQAIRLVLDHARSTGTTVTVLARDPHGEHLLDVAPDGTVTPATPPQPDVTVLPAAAPTPHTQTPSRSQDRAAPPARKRWPVAAGAALTLLAAAASVLLWNPWQSPTSAPSAAAGAAVAAQATAPAAGNRAATTGHTWPAAAPDANWTRAASWQAAEDARQRLTRRTWTPPSPSTGTTAVTAPTAPGAPTAPVAPARPVAPPAAPQRPAPGPPAPRTEEPSVTVYPDPVIVPDTN